MTTKRRGRPPGPPEARRSIQIPVRVTRDERARYEAAAAATGTTLSEEARLAWEWLARRVGR